MRRGAAWPAERRSRRCPQEHGWAPQPAVAGPGGRGGAGAGRAFVIASSASVRRPVSGASISASSVRCERPASTCACPGGRSPVSGASERPGVRRPAVRCPSGRPTSMRSRVPPCPTGMWGRRRRAGSRMAGMAGVGVVARRIHDRLVVCPSRARSSRPAQVVLDQRRWRLGLGRRRVRWLGTGEADQKRLDAREERPLVRGLGCAARRRLRSVVIVCGPGPGRLAAASLPGCTATCGCGRGAAATCSERRPLEAGDALTCEVGGGGEGI
jgi:hypothetical protein